MPGQKIVVYGFCHMNSKKITKLLAPATRTPGIALCPVHVQSLDFQIVVHSVMMMYTLCTFCDTSVPILQLARDNICSLLKETDFNDVCYNMTRKTSFKVMGMSQWVQRPLQ